MNSTLRRVTAVLGAALVLAAAVPLAAVAQTLPKGRKTWTIENDKIVVVIAPGGGHIAAAWLKSGRGAKVNPFWIPPWKSTEPGGWQGHEAEYAGKPAAQLLCCILGHNLCLDFFGAPSAAETKAGIPVHGEAPCVNWKLKSQSKSSITYETTLPLAQMKVSRTVKLTPKSAGIWISETVENLSAFDRPFGWQQHVTLGPPFLASGESFFDTNGGWSTVDPAEFSKKQRLKKGGEFEWPNAPGADGTDVDLRPYPTGKTNSDFTVSEVNKNYKWGWFTAVNVKKGLAIGYVWPRADYPWTANWEETHARDGKPWLSKAVARGIEFGTSPFAHPRREAVTMGKLHDTPTYRWIEAKGKQTVSYGAFLAPIPAGVTGVKGVMLSASGIGIETTGVEKQITVPIKR